MIEFRQALKPTGPDRIEVMKQAMRWVATNPHLNWFILLIEPEVPSGGPVYVFQGFEQEHELHTTRSRYDRMEVSAKAHSVGWGNRGELQDAYVEHKRQATEKLKTAGEAMRDSVFESVWKAQRTDPTATG